MASIVENRKTDSREKRISRTRAIEIAMNINGISYGLASRYTNSELRECLRQVHMKADF